MTLFRMACFGLLLALLACNNTDAPTTETTSEPVVESKTAGYELVSEETDFHFVIVSNSAGPVTARFPNGATGSLDASGKGAIAIRLSTMKSLDQNDLENPLRDANVVEAFFGVRPSAVFPEKVDEAWTLLTDKLERAVATARFEIAGMESLAGLADGASATGNLAGDLVLWNTVKVPLSLPVNLSRTGDRIEMTSTESVTFNLEEALGSELRKLTFDTLLAAGCAHQPGIQNDVTITIDKAVFKTD